MEILKLLTYALIIFMSLLASIGVDFVFFGTAEVTNEQWKIAEEFCNGNDGVDYVFGNRMIYCNNKAKVSFKELAE